MKYLFVVNPVSGKRNAETTLIPRIHAYFSANNFDYAVEVTQYPKHATEIVKAYAEAGGDLRVCACGGDGTLHEVACGAVGFGNVEMTCCPVGGGNDFIKCFGDAESFLDFDMITHAKSIPIDLLTVNDTYCINIVSVGLDADICEAIPKYRKIKLLRGPMAYNLAMIECTFFKPLGKQLHVEVGDDIELNGSFILSVASNGRVYGGGYYATPDAEVDDGIIDFVAVEKMNLPRIASMIAVYKKGKHIDNGAVIPSLDDKMCYHRANRIKMTSQKEFIVNMDGETLVTDCVEIGVLRHALRFVVPAQTAKTDTP